MLPHQWIRDLLALVYQEGRNRMATHQRILRRTDQRVLRVDNDHREPLRCAERNGGVVHQVHPCSCIFLYLRLRRAYRGLLPEASTSQVSAWQQGFFSDGLKESLMRDRLGIFSVFTNVYPTNSYVFVRQRMCTLSAY